MTRQEYDKLLSVITDLQDELLIRMAVATGLRREDLCNIKVVDLIVPEKRLRFYEAKKRKWREIDLPDAVMVCLQKYWNMLDKKERGREYFFDFVGRTAIHTSIIGAGWLGYRRDHFMRSELPARSLLMTRVDGRADFEIDRRPD